MGCRRRHRDLIFSQFSFDCCQNSFASGALPRTPLGGLQRPQTPAEFGWVTHRYATPSPLQSQQLNLRACPHPPGKGSFREHREGGKEEEGSVRELEGREGGGRRNVGGREEGGRRGGRTKVGVRALEGRNVGREEGRGGGRREGGREGRREGGREGGRRKVGVRELELLRELEWRKVGGGTMEEGRIEGGGGAGEAGGRTKVGVRELEGRKLGGGRKGRE